MMRNDVKCIASRRSFDESFPNLFKLIFFDEHINQFNGILTDLENGRRTHCDHNTNRKQQESILFFAILYIFFYMLKRVETGKHIFFLLFVNTHIRTSSYFTLYTHTHTHTHTHRERERSKYTDRW